MSLIIISVAAVLGVVMLGVGLRGRRVSDHPHCRRCGFDLYGKPDAANCPECGRALTSPRSVRAGRRQRRKGLAWSGGAVLTLAAALGGFVGADALSGIDWQPYKPVWWLNAELATEEDQKAAIAELADRFSRDELTPAQVDSVVARLLVIQADAKQNWLEEFGDFVETAWQKKLVDEETFARYVEQGVKLTMEVRPKVRLGDPVAYRQEMTSRMGSASSSLPRLWLSTNSERFVMGEHEQKLGSGSGRSLGGSSRGSSWSSISIEALSDGRLPLGEYQCKFVMRAAVKEGHDGKAIHEWDVTLTDTTQVIPRETQTVERIDDESLLAAMEEAVKIEHVRVRPSNDRWRINVQLDIKPRPVGLAHRVVIAAGDRRIEVNSISKEASGQTAWSIGTSVEEPLDASKVDVILEPDIDAAHRTVDVFDMWDRPITFSDVDVEVEEER